MAAHKQKQQTAVLDPHCLLIGALFSFPHLSLSFSSHFSLPFSSAYLVPVVSHTGMRLLIKSMTQEDMNTDTLERHIQTCLLTDTCAVAGSFSNEVVRYVSQIVSIAQRFSLFFFWYVQKISPHNQHILGGRSITTNKKG